MNLFRALTDFFLPASKETSRAQKLTWEKVQKCAAPRTISCGDVSVLGLLPYRDPDIKALLWALKYRNSTHASMLCAKILEEALSEEWVEAQLRVTLPCLVAVPRSSESLRRYGGNHLDSVIKALAMSYQSAFVKDALRRESRAMRQTTLSRADRNENMRGAFFVNSKYRESIAGAHVIVVDDVITTGATLTEATRALRAAGAVEVSPIAIAYS